MIPTHVTGQIRSGFSDASLTAVARGLAAGLSPPTPLLAAPDSGIGGGPGGDAPGEDEGAGVDRWNSPRTFSARTQRLLVP